MGKMEAKTALRGAKLRGKTQSVFEANIWTVSRLCLNETSTANGRSRRAKRILLPCADWSRGASAAWGGPQSQSGPKLWSFCSDPAWKKQEIEQILFPPPPPTSAKCLLHPLAAGCGSVSGMWHLPCGTGWGRGLGLRWCWREVLLCGLTRELSEVLGWESVGRETARPFPHLSSSAIRLHRH